MLFSLPNGTNLLRSRIRGGTCPLCLRQRRESGHRGRSESCQ